MKTFTLKELNKKYGGKEIFLNIRMVPSFNWKEKGTVEVEVIKTSSVVRENFQSLQEINFRFRNH
tara:strand:+ start:217 stop:411 length:195 start_codon:yes stop_codon:yes gene_type:complete